MRELRDGDYFQGGASERRQSRSSRKGLKQCPNCRTSLYPLDEILNSFQYAYAKANTSGLKMRLRTAAVKMYPPSGSLGLRHTFRGVRVVASAVRRARAE